MIDILADILRIEGWPLYTNDPADMGGPTKGGITMGALSAWRQRPIAAEDVEKLGEDEARAIYRSRYIVGPNFDKLADELLKATMVDTGVLHGPEKAIKWLQEACNRERLIIGTERVPYIGELVVDGSCGSKTQYAANHLPGEFLRQRVIAARLRYTGRQIMKPKQVRFAAGWCNRIAVLLERPLDLPREGG